MQIVVTPRSRAADSRKRYARYKEEGGVKYEAILEGARARARSRPRPKLRQLINSARFRAKKADISFTITASDIYYPTHCPILGLRLDYQGRGRKGGAPDSPSLDRWNNTKGYVPGNVYVISWRANQIKNNATPAELRKVAAYAEHGINSLLGRSQ